MKRIAKRVGDVSDLPDYSFGSTSLGWWGAMGFILIEGMAFVLAIGAYYYLLPNEIHWPPASHPPPLLWGTVFTALGLLSLVPNVWVDHRAKAQDLRGVRIGMIVMVALGLLLLLVRVLEFAALNVRWDITAYGSIVWALIVLHTFHTITDVFDTGVLAVMTWRKKMDGRHFSDVSDNALYWNFIVGSWVALYVVIYWTPRWV